MPVLLLERDGLAAVPGVQDCLLVVGRHGLTSQEQCLGWVSVPGLLPVVGHLAVPVDGEGLRLGVDKQHARLALHDRQLLPLTGV